MNGADALALEGLAGGWLTPAQSTWAARQGRPAKAGQTRGAPGPLCSVPAVDGAIKIFFKFLFSNTRLLVKHLQGNSPRADELKETKLWTRSEKCKL